MTKGIREGPIIALELLQSNFTLTVRNKPILPRRPALEKLYQWFDPSLPLAMILAVSLITIALPWIVSLFGDDETRP